MCDSEAKVEGNDQEFILTINTSKKRKGGEMKKLWIVYDGRAIPLKHLPKEATDMMAKEGATWSKAFFPCNTDDASILVTCDSLKEARSYKGEFGDGNCIFEYDIVNKQLVNEKFVEVL